MACVALAALSPSLAWLEAEQFKVATSAYPVTITVKENVVHTLLAGPVFDMDQAPLVVRGQSLEAVRVSMGNPHCVIFAQDVLGNRGFYDAICTRYRKGPWPGPVPQ